jgi:hypothetical protein
MGEGNWVMTSDEPDVDSILANARRAGLPLNEAEAAELVKGVARMQEMTRRVRELLKEADEPAVTFSPVQETSS